MWSGKRTSPVVAIFWQTFGAANVQSLGLGFCIVEDASFTRVKRETVTVFVVLVGHVGNDDVLVVSVTDTMKSERGVSVGI